MVIAEGLSGGWRMGVKYYVVITVAADWAAGGASDGNVQGTSAS